MAGGDEWTAGADIAHLGAVELLTPALDDSAWYFRDVLGMEIVHADMPSVHLRGYGDHVTTTLTLTSAARPGVGRISWRAASPAALARRVAAIEAVGLGEGWNDGDVGRVRSTASATPMAMPWRSITRSRLTRRRPLCARR